MTACEEGICRVFFCLVFMDLHNFRCCPISFPRGEPSNGIRCIVLCGDGFARRRGPSATPRHLLCKHRGRGRRKNERCVNSFICCHRPYNIKPKGSTVDGTWSEIAWATGMAAVSMGVCEYAVVCANDVVHFVVFSFLDCDCETLVIS
jgi:hypothetical protein